MYMSNNETQIVDRFIYPGSQLWEELVGTRYIDAESTVGQHCTNMYNFSDSSLAAELIKAALERVDWDEIRENNPDLWSN